MCRTHIFKVTYIYLRTLICSALTFFAGACDFPNCPVLWTVASKSNQPAVAHRRLAKCDFAALYCIMAAAPYT